MGIYDCNFCDMGQKKRAMIYKLTEDLSKEDLLFLLKNKLLCKWVVKRRMKKNANNKISKI